MPGQCMVVELDSAQNIVYNKVVPICASAVAVSYNQYKPSTQLFFSLKVAVNPTAVYCCDSDVGIEQLDAWRVGRKRSLETV